MRDEQIYHEYANWKMDHNDLLKYLVENDSDLILRFKHVIEVIDHLYDKLVDDSHHSEDEDNIFETGFYYTLDQMEEIIKLLSKNYDNDIKKLENRAKDVNLLLSVIDFQNELLGVDDVEQSDLDKLLDFEKNILKYLENREQVPETMFKSFDKMTRDMFKRLDVEYYPINDIFLEIADELGII